MAIFKNIYYLLCSNGNMRESKYEGEGMKAEEKKENFLYF